MNSFRQAFKIQTEKKHTECNTQDLMLPSPKSLQNSFLNRLLVVTFTALTSPLIFKCIQLKIYQDCCSVMSCFHLKHP